MTDAKPSTSDRIVHATLTLIAGEGLGSVTMRRIAETAGVARQTLYNHYPDVDSIVVEAIERHNRESIAMLESAIAVVDHPSDRIEQLVRHVVAVGAHTHQIHGIERGLSAEARARLSGHENAIDRWVGQIMRNGQESGVFRPDLDPGVDVDLIRRMLDGLAEQAGRSPEAAAAIAEAGTRTILAAISSPA